MTSAFLGRLAAVLVCTMLLWNGSEADQVRQCMSVDTGAPIKVSVTTTRFNSIFFDGQKSRMYTKTVFPTGAASISGFSGKHVVHFTFTSGPFAGATLDGYMPILARKRLEDFVDSSGQSSTDSTCGPCSQCTGDPHITNFMGTTYDFIGDVDQLDDLQYQYMGPCDESQSGFDNMPLQVFGKHRLLFPHYSDTSGVEYVTAKLYDFDEEEIHLVWLNSEIHHYVTLDFDDFDDDDGEDYAQLMYRNRTDTPSELTEKGWTQLGDKYEVYYIQHQDYRAEIMIDIDGCLVTLSMAYQGISVDDQRSMHLFSTEITCYMCMTCGLLGDNICE